MTKLLFDAWLILSYCYKAEQSRNSSHLSLTISELQSGWLVAAAHDTIVSIQQVMGTSHLWVIDRDGRVFLFSVRDKSWRQISTPKLGSRNCFKRVSAVEQCAWAISANQQPYVFVHATELPIRVKVETYENQRWGIVNSWSKKSVRSYFFVAYCNNS